MYKESIIKAKDFKKKDKSEWSEFEVCLDIAMNSLKKMDMYFWTLHDVLKREDLIPNNTRRFFTNVINAMFDSIFLILISLWDFKKIRKGKADDVSIHSILKLAICEERKDNQVPEGNERLESYDEINNQFLNSLCQNQSTLINMKLYRNKKIGHVTKYNKVIPSFEYKEIVFETQRLINKIYAKYTNSNEDEFKLIKEGDGKLQRKTTPAMSMKNYTQVDDLFRYFETH